MSPLVIAGMAAMVVGLGTWAVSSPLAKGASRSHAYLRPKSDHEIFRRRQMIWIRSVAAGIVLFGAGISIFGLLNGK